MSFETILASGEVAQVITGLATFAGMPIFMEIPLHHGISNERGFELAAVPRIVAGRD